MSALRKLLVVDDDPTIGKSIRRVLEKEYVVTTAANAKEALLKLQEESFDLVYADIRMPGISGIELAEQVKEKQPWTPIVIITGYETEENHRRATACGVEGFLQKPLSPEMIESSAKMARVPPVLTVVTPDPVVELPKDETKTHWTDVALFFAAPFIGLFYALLLPFVGMAMMTMIAAKAFAKTKTYVKVKEVGLFIAAPFIGLMYALTLPFLGLGMMLWVGGKALYATTQKTE